MFKYFQRLLCAAAICACCCSAAFAANFSDTSAHWAAAPIQTLSQYGVVNGYPNGSFRPDGTMTNAEAAKVICAFLSTYSSALPAETKPAVLPADAAAHWSAPFVQQLAQRGALRISEYDGRFLPNTPITRAAFTRMLVRALGFLQETPTADCGFRDNGAFPASLNYYIAAAKNLGLVSGYADGTFRAASPITRGEICSVLARALPKTPKPLKNIETYSFSADLPSFRAFAGLTDEYRIDSEPHSTMALYRKEQVSSEMISSYADYIRRSGYWYDADSASKGGGVDYFYQFSRGETVKLYSIKIDTVEYFCVEVTSSSDISSTLRQDALAALSFSQASPSWWSRSIASDPSFFFDGACLPIGFLDSLDQQYRAAGFRLLSQTQKDDLVTAVYQKDQLQLTVTSHASTGNLMLSLHHIYD